MLTILFPIKIVDINLSYFSVNFKTNKAFFASLLFFSLKFFIFILFKDEKAVSVAEKYADKVMVGKINIDENDEISSENRVRNIPTVLFFKDGQMKDATVTMMIKYLQM